MGAHAVLCGLGPNVVMTLQSMGIELEGIDTVLELESALERLGIVMDPDDSGRGEHDLSDEADR